MPAQVGPTAIAYIKDLQWVDTPDRLFQDLLEETVTADDLPRRARSQAVGARSRRDVSGQLSRFGYDAQEGSVLVRYDAAMSRPAARAVETRRFEAREPADGTARTVGPALNAAANRVAMEVAQWVGG